MTNITQVVSPIPPAGHRGIDSRDIFVTKQEAFQDHLYGSTVAELNTVATQLNTLANEVEAIANEVEAIGEDVVAVEASISPHYDNINAVVANATNINAVVANATNINAVATNEDNINAVATNMPKITSVDTNMSDIVLVSDAIQAGTLPTIINDSAISTTSTWSSDKLNDEITTAIGGIDLSSKQDTLVSGTNIKTVNGESILGAGDINIDTSSYSTGDIVSSTDPNKYVAPTWIKADGNSYDPEVYTELKNNLGATTLYDNGRIADNIPIVECDITTNFDNLGTSVSNIFYSSNKEYAIVATSTATQMLVFQFDSTINKYKLKANLTIAQANYTSATISNSGKYIAYTSGNNGYLSMWNGTTYNMASSISIAGYAHQLATISDNDLYVAFTCLSSVYLKIYYITPDTSTMTACTGSINTGANNWCFWLPNVNIIVIQAYASVVMYSLSGTVATTIQTITSTAIRDITFINADRTYLLVHKTVSPYFEIFKVSGTGFTSIYTEPYNSNPFGALWHENRLLILNSKAVGTFDAVYTIDISNDSVTKNTTMFTNNTNHVFRSSDILWDTTSSKYFNNRSKVLYFRDVSYIYDEVSNQYKFYDFGWGSVNNNGGALISCYYSRNKDYILIRHNGTTFIANVEDELYPVRSTLQFIRKRTTYTNNDHAYFTFHPYIFISIDNPIANSRPFCIIDPQTGVISVHPAQLSFDISPTGFVGYSMSEDGDCAIRVYYNGTSYSANATYLKNGVWTDAFNPSVLSDSEQFNPDTMIAHKYNYLYYSYGTSQVRAIYIQINNNTIFAHSNMATGLGAALGAGRVVVSKDDSTVVYANNHNSVAQTWYAKRGNITYTLGAYGNNVNNNGIFVSDDGKLIIIGNGLVSVWFWSELKNTYIAIEVAEGLYYVSNYGLRGKSKATQFKPNMEYGITENFKKMQKKYKVPYIPNITNSAENSVKAYIKTGVVL